MGRVGDQVGRPPYLLQPEINRHFDRINGGTGFDLLELGDSLHRTGDLNPAAVHAGFDEVELCEGVIAVLLKP